MNPELQTSDAERLVLLAQLQAAEQNLRAGLHAQGLNNTARAHLERARAHLSEAYIAINEAKSVRSVAQLVNDLTGVEAVIEQMQNRKSNHI